MAQTVSTGNVPEGEGSKPSSAPAGAGSNLQAAFVEPVTLSSGTGNVWANACSSAYQHRAKLRRGTMIVGARICRATESEGFWVRGVNGSTLDF